MLMEPLALAQSVEDVVDDRLVDVELRDVMTQVLVAVVAEQVQLRLVGAQDRAVLPHPVYPDRRRLEEIGELKLALPKRTLRFHLTSERFARLPCGHARLDRGLPSGSAQAR